MSWRFVLHFQLLTMRFVLFYLPACLFVCLLVAAWTTQRLSLWPLVKLRVRTYMYAFGSLGHFVCLHQVVTRVLRFEVLYLSLHFISVTFILLSQISICLFKKKSLIFIPVPQMRPYKPKTHVPSRRVQEQPSLLKLAALPKELLYDYGLLTLTWSTQKVVLNLVVLQPHERVNLTSFLTLKPETN
jgi:hypothetical protein